MTTIIVESEIRRLAIGCLHVLYRRALLDFPSSTRAAPSTWVHVSSGLPLDPGFTVWFPFRVWWKVWQKVAVPVILQYWNRNLSVIGTFEDQISLLVAELTNRLSLEGMIPSVPAVEVPDIPPNSIWTGLYGNSWWLRLHFKVEDLPGKNESLF